MSNKQDKTLQEFLNIISGLIKSSHKVINDMDTRYPLMFTAENENTSQHFLVTIQDITNHMEHEDTIIEFSNCIQILADNINNTITKEINAPYDTKFKQ